MRPVLVAAATALLAGDEAASTATQRTGEMALDIALMRVLGADVRGPGLGALAAEALDIYVARDATEADRVRAACCAAARRAAAANSCRSRRARTRGVTAARPKCFSPGDGCSNAEIAQRLFLGAHGRDARVIAAHEARRPEPRPAHRTSA
jgi:hypothetical protein